MPITSTDISNLPDYSNSQLLKLYRWAMANGAAGQSRTINGRSITFPTLTEIIKAIDWLQGQVNSESGEDGTAQIEFYES